MDELESGTDFAGYRIEAVAGCGGMGVVFTPPTTTAGAFKTVELGSVSGPCGDLTKKLRQFPFHPVPAGRYKVRFTGTRVFDPQGFWIGYRTVVVPRAKAVR